MKALNSAIKTVIDDRICRAKLAIVVLSILLLFSMWFSLVVGAYDVSIKNFIQSLLSSYHHETTFTRDYLVIMNIRLPRLILGVMVGAALSVSGVLMQGLFRNPLADPGIMGISSGAGLGAVSMIVLGGSMPSISLLLGKFHIAIGAFIGALITTFILYAIATRQGRTSIATMLLAGITLSALCASVLGILVFMANDHQLRDITFWNLGSLAGTTWSRVWLCCPFILSGLLFSPFLTRAMNAFSLGEAVAGHLGFSVQRTKYFVILLVALMCGAAVAVSGIIGFIGIVIPHILRLTIGPDHRYLIIGSALLGASILILADTFSRFIVAPAELPIGIVTSLLGAPFFLWILLRQRGAIDQ